MRKIENISIEDKSYKKHKKAYEYAMAKLKQECGQACESLIHNMNSLTSRSGNQLPFTSINYGTCTLLEGQILIDSILDATIDGTGAHHATSIFPCQIFQYKKGVNDKEGTPNYYLKLKALECMSKRLYPNFANCDWSAQKSWVEQDRDIKEKILSELSSEDYKKLESILRNNPELADSIGLKVEEDL